MGNHNVCFRGEGGAFEWVPATPSSLTATVNSPKLEALSPLYLVLVSDLL